MRIIGAMFQMSQTNPRLPVPNDHRYTRNIHKIIRHININKNKYINTSQGQGFPKDSLLLFFMCHLLGANPRERPGGRCQIICVINYTGRISTLYLVSLPLTPLSEGLNYNYRIQKHLLIIAITGPGQSPVQVQSESNIKRSQKISKDNKDLDQGIAL